MSKILYSVYLTLSVIIERRTLHVRFFNISTLVCIRVSLSIPGHVMGFLVFLTSTKRPRGLRDRRRREGPRLGY